MPPAKPHASNAASKARQLSSDLDYRDALRAVLPDLQWTRWQNPPIEAYWPRGGKPPGDLDIDREVSILEARRADKNKQAASLRDDKQLATDRIEDPYLTAREGVARAFGAGRAEVRLAESRKRLEPDLAQAERSASKQHRDVMRVREDLERQAAGDLKALTEMAGSAPGYEAPRNDELDDLISCLRMAEDGLARRVKDARASAMSIRSREQNVWLRAFIYEIGETWHLLTGFMPSSSSGPFNDFVQAALRTGGLEIGDMGMEHHIRMVAEDAAHSEFRRFDRFSEPSAALKGLSLSGKTVYEDAESVRIGGGNRNLPPRSGRLKQIEACSAQMTDEFVAWMKAGERDPLDEFLRRHRLTAYLQSCRPEWRNVLIEKLEEAGLAHSHPSRSAAP